MKLDHNNRTISFEIPRPGKNLATEIKSALAIMEADAAEARQAHAEYAEIEAKRDSIEAELNALQASPTLDGVVKIPGLKSQLEMMERLDAGGWKQLLAFMDAKLDDSILNVVRDLIFKAVISPSLQEIERHFLEVLAPLAPWPFRRHFVRGSQLYQNAARFQLKHDNFRHNAIGFVKRIEELSEILRAVLEGKYVLTVPMADGGPAPVSESAEQAAA